MAPKKAAASKAPPFVPDFTETIALGKMRMLWKTAKESGGQPLAPYEKDELIVQIKGDDYLWNANVEQAVHGSDITAAQSQALKQCLSCVKRNRAMKKVNPPKRNRSVREKIRPTVATRDLRKSSLVHRLTLLEYN